MYEEVEQPLRELGVDEALEARARLMATPAAATSPNGIKLVRVISLAGGNATLEVTFFNSNHLAAIVAAFGLDSSVARRVFPISGGTRIRAGSAAGQVQVTGIAAAMGQPSVLELTIRPIGDYSTYKLSVTNEVATTVFDPLFAEISFKFRPGCFNTNCAPEWETGLPPFDEPAIDYTAKDFASFRRTMIEAMSTRVPEWEPTSEADLDMVLAELFSAAADELSDYQDRVMNEAYLATARKRVSLARHARLMDYHIHQGNQASSWLALEIEHHSGAQKGFDLAQGLTAWAGRSEPPMLDKPDDSAAVFISRHKDAQAIHQYLNNIGLYTWSDTVTTLKAGSTRADLKLYNRLYLDETGPVQEAKLQSHANQIRNLIWQGKITQLLIEEHLNPETGLRAGRDPSKRQLLRLRPGTEGAETVYDPVKNEYFVRVRWIKEDALRRDYCFMVNCPAGVPGTAVGRVDNISMFHGNLVEVFHGRRGEVSFKHHDDLLTISPAIPLELHYEQTRWGTLCRLPEVSLAYKTTEPGGDIAPVSTLEVKVVPPGGPGDEWDEMPTLVYSDDSADYGDHFIVETDENRRSLIRFGNGKNGRELPDGAVVECSYQYGMPLDGNVGADSIVRFDESSVVGVPAALGIKLRKCWNPFDVTNGRDREPASEIIRRVPEAYRYRQLRAVTLADYVARAEEIKGVSRAAARYAWTGSWRTVQIAIDPEGTSELSYALRQEVENYLNAVRLIGEDLEVRPPQFVPLEIKVKLCAEEDVWVEDLRFVLEQEFSDSWTPDGRMGFFHPDLWTFGQPIFASQIIGRALKIKGVKHAVAHQASPGPPPEMISVWIKRWNSPHPPVASLEQLAHNEIILVENDPDHQERGSITFDIKGGRQ